MEEVRAQASVNGGNMKHARHQVLQRRDGKLALLEAVFPAMGEIEAELSKFHAAAAAYNKLIATRFEKLSEIEQLLVARAAQLRDKTQFEADLVAAEDALDSKKSLKLTGDALLVQDARRKFLPGEIACSASAISELEARIRGLSAAAGIEVGAVVKGILGRIKNEEGRVVDGDLDQIARFLPLAGK